MTIFRTWPLLPGCRTYVSALVGLLLLTRLPAVAQTINYCTNPPALVGRGGFTVSQTRGCAPLTVTVAKNVPTIVNEAYNYDYKGGEPNSIVLEDKRTHEYTVPGTYTIIQFSSVGGTGSVACATVDVLPVPPVQFSVRSCVDRKGAVLVRLDNDTRRYDKLLIDWGDGTPEEAVPISAVPADGVIEHTYSRDATFPVRVRGGYTDVACGNSSTAQPIQVSTTGAQTRPIVRTVTTQDANTIVIDYQSTGDAPVEIRQKNAGGTFQPITSGLGQSPGTFTVRTDASRSQCFQLVTKDPCGNLLTSDDVCSLALTATAEDKQNRLAWAAYAGTGTFQFYRVLRNGSPVRNIPARTTTNYVDNANIQCRQSYCYTLEATVRNVASSGQVVVTSAPVCVTGQNGERPGVLPNVFASVEDGTQIRVQATPPATGATPQFALLFSRADTPDGPFQPVAQLTNRDVFTDDQVQPNQQSYCYQVTYQNSCGIQSQPSGPVCTVHLSAKDAATIGWTTPSPFVPGPVTRYTLEIVDTDLQTREQRDLGLNTSFRPDLTNPGLQSQRFRIIAISAGGVPSYSNFFELRQDAKLFVPTAFTPNNDGVNDRFEAKGLFLDQFSLTVYNRWGEVVYFTADPRDGWDGTVGGQSAPAAQYLYRIQAQDLSGRKINRTGSVQLIR